jgi:UDP-N-acetylglucosamine 2-epimerase (non-hydrolysing)
LRTIVFIMGTRPEAIKLAPVIHELKRKKFVKVVVICTGQHEEMLEQVVNLFNIKIDFYLRAMKDAKGLPALTSYLCSELPKILDSIKPTTVVVHGDTTSAFCGALSAFYMKFPVVHIEAGLRSANINSPFPEELNRQLLGRICTFHYSPTEAAKRNLLIENVPEKSILVTGNTVVDALLWCRGKISDNLNLTNQLNTSFGFQSNMSYNILVTAHRRENLGERLELICSAISSATKRNSNLRFYFPMHLNPLVRGTVNRYLSKNANVILTDPLNYQEFVFALSKMDLILTDSGGIQEEAPTFGTKVLILREETERMEAVEAGFAKLVGTNPKSIIDAIEFEYRSRDNSDQKVTNPFGDGKAASRICEHLLNL